MIEKNLEQINEIIASEGDCPRKTNGVTIDCDDCVLRNYFKDGCCDDADSLEKARELKEEGFMDLKVGDYVIYDKSLNMDNQGVCLHLACMDCLADGKPHKILDVKADSDSCDRINLKFEGLSVWLYTFKSLTKIDKTTVHDTPCGVFTEGEEVFLDKTTCKLIFLAYIPSLVRPYACVYIDDKEAYLNHEDDVTIVNCETISQIPNVNYVPFTELNIDWIKTKLKIKCKADGNIYVIENVSYSDNKWIYELVHDGTRKHVSLETLFTYYTFLDGGVIGKKSVR